MHLNNFHACLIKSDKQWVGLKGRLPKFQQLNGGWKALSKDLQARFFFFFFKSAGWPVNTTCADNFNALREWLKQETKVYTLAEIHLKMVEIAGPTDNAWCIKWLKRNASKVWRTHKLLIIWRNCKESLLQDCGWLLDKWQMVSRKIGWHKRGIRKNNFNCFKAMGRTTKGVGEAMPLPFPLFFRILIFYFDHTAVFLMLM